MPSFNFLERLKLNIKNVEEMKGDIDEMFDILSKDCEFNTSTLGECGNLENSSSIDMGLAGEMRICKVNHCPLIR